MKVRFWGSRGSLCSSVNETSIRRKLKGALEIARKKGLDADSDLENFIDNELPFWMRGSYGVNTPCVEIRQGDDFLLCDAGSGLRDFGHYILGTSGKGAPKEYRILISHPHWDHIQGFPFFTPAYIPGNRIYIYGCHDGMEKAFFTQQSQPFFPINFGDLGAEIEFVIMDPHKFYWINGFHVMPKEQNHPGRSFGYRFEREGKTVVYSTDAEHKSEGDRDITSFIEFFNRADLLIFDAQYNFADASTVKEDWGHSNNLVGVELAEKSKVKHLCLFHQEPISDDRDLDQFLEDTKRLVSLLGDDAFFEVSIARDGMEIDV